LFKLTPAEARLLAQLVSGASLAEAALNLGIAEATARTHRNHVFTKTGVSRRADLIVLVGRLLPPIRQTH
jgi:DNA-binding CsgD family transcriptional regulator